MPYVRVSITLPRDLATAADKRARALDRSRSWLVAEALRQYLGGTPTPLAESPPGRGRAVREPSPPPYSAAGSPLGEYRLEQLKVDLALTPEQRVLAAQEAARVSEYVRKRPPGHRILQFDRYEDYLEWKRRENLL